MNEIIDKKAFWENILLESVEILDNLIFYSVYQRYYLDSIHDNYAIIVAQTDVYRNFFLKNALRPIQTTFRKVLKKPDFQLRVAVSKAPLLEELLPEGNYHLPFSPEVDNKSDINTLHARYGDIMGIVDNHPLFVKVQMPLERGGWACWPQALTNRCKEYGIMPVLNAIRYVGNMPNAKNRRALLFHVIDNGHFGPKLTITPSLVGHALPEEEFTSPLPLAL
jgi:hypothetical protein